MPIPWPLEEIDLLIREGRNGEARKRLQLIEVKSVRRSDRRPLANLARRAQMLNLAIRLLNPVVRSEEILAAQATDAERAEYGVSLIFLGATQEGLEILNGVSDDGIPEALLFRSFGLFSSWNYKEAIPLLEKYIPRAPSTYQRLVGTLNLTAALIFCRELDRASEHLENLLRESEAGFKMLHGNSLELGAQIEIFRGRFRKAESLLAKAATVLEDTGGIYEFFVRKWWAILAVNRDGPTPAAVEGLGRIGKEAILKRHWETVRDCDYHRGIALRDGGLLKHVYFGTPYERFRERIPLGMLDRGCSRDEYPWQLGSGSSSRVFDLAMGSEELGRHDMNSNPKLLTAFRALANDFYSPARIATLFSFLFPNEFFNPQSSPHRVHETLRRLRGWFKLNDVPLTVSHDAGQYRLAATGPYCLLTRPQNSITRREFLINELHRTRSAQSFSSMTVAQILGVSPRFSQDLLRWAVESGQMSRFGQGRGTRYRFNSAALELPLVS